MEKIVKQTLLYDFYGELLTERQRQIYEDVVWNDLSLSEAADNRGISRQGVHDLIRRCDRALLEYEQKLHLVEKFLKIRENVNEIHALTAHPAAEEDSETMRRIAALSSEILEEL